MSLAFKLYVNIACCNSRYTYVVFAVFSGGLCQVLRDDGCQVQQVLRWKDHLKESSQQAAPERKGQTPAWLAGINALLSQYLTMGLCFI